MVVSSTSTGSGPFRRRPSLGDGSTLSAGAVRRSFDLTSPSSSATAAAVAAGAAAAAARRASPSPSSTSARRAASSGRRASPAPSSAAAYTRPIQAQASPTTTTAQPGERRRGSSATPWEGQTSPTNKTRRATLGISSSLNVPLASFALNWASPRRGSTNTMASSFGDYLTAHSSDPHAIAPWERRSSAGDGQSPAERSIRSRRRPSAASNSSFDSNESGADRTERIQKKLHGFFGEEPPSDQIFQTPQPPSAQSNERPQVDRQGSYTSGDDGKQDGQVAEPSRPRTPQPDSDVTPWLFQDPQDIQNLGDAPVRDNIQNHVLEGPNPKSTSRIHLPGRHRHNTSTGNELSASTSQLDLGAMTSAPTYKRSTTNLAGKITAPVNARQNSSVNLSLGDGAADLRSSKNDPSGKEKRSLFDRLRGHRHKGEPVNINLGAARGSTASLSQQPSKSVGSDTALPTYTTPGDDVAAASKAVNRPPLVQQQTKRDYHRLPFNSSKKRGYSQADNFAARDPNQAGPDVTSTDALWNLDTDLSHMEGIVSNNSGGPQPPSRGGGPQPNWNWDNGVPEVQTSDVSGAWDAPDSWIVKRAGDENVGKLHEIDERVPRKDDDPGVPFYIRIFRPDSTFSTLSVPLNTTAAEIVEILGKKTFLPDDLSNCHIIMRRHDVSRQLDPGERPVVLQKKLLEQAGYTEEDHIAEIGAEDHTYLCRFNFLPAKMIGYSSFEREPGFNKMQKFSSIDLRGRNLITIPIALYQKSNEIVYLDLSKNISLDVPKDFIQGCTSLKRVEYTSNEAWRLPQSFSLASKLNLLNLSNNRLEQLDHADLHKLESLASLQLGNNKLTQLPSTFSQFKALRTLNLSSNSLSELPECVCDISTLVELDISFNSIAQLKHVGRLENLERLWCTNNKLTGSPEPFEKLRNLREIDCRFNNIGNLDSLTQLPALEILYAGHNSITAFEGSFTKIRTLYLDHNPITKFTLNNPVPTLSTLSLASAKLASLPEELFTRCNGLVRLKLDKNHIAALSSQIGRLQKLEYLSVAKNLLSTLPTDIGRLYELRFLDVRENNISFLPPDLWFCRRLETLNISSNVLERFPRPPTQANLQSLEQSMNSTPSLTTSSPISEEPSSTSSGRRGSQTPSYASTSSTPPSVATTPSGYRKGSTASAFPANSRKPSMLSRSSTEQTLSNFSPASRKDSINVNRTNATMAGSLRSLYLADNRLSEDVFDEITVLQELRVANLSYNELFDIPHRTIRRWTQLTELFLSGNDLSSLPTEDFEDMASLRVLHINNNKFQVLPAELGKAKTLAVLDVGSNSLKYNVANWPYDWNWNCNPNLKYLNLSGNKRLEIKPATTWGASRNEQNLTDFSSLTNLRVLGLMDVTLMITSVPDESEDRRVRTSGSQVATMAYGLADTLGRSDHLSTVDLVIPRLAHDDEILVGLFDGQQQNTSGSRIAKFLHENFRASFEEQLSRKTGEDTPMDALRRTYLALNKELATWANQSLEVKERRSLHRGSIVSQTINKDDVNSGCCATVLFIQGMDLYVSNVGDAEAVLIKSNGSHRKITQKHDPAEASERARIREAGGFVSKQGKLNDELTVSRAFGYIQMTPAVIAAPFTQKITITESDEIILLATRELWDYLTPDFAVDIARSERGDLMRAAQKLRDLAIAFGASGKINVMLLGVNDLRRRERARYRSHSMSMGPSSLFEEPWNSRRPKRGRDATADSKLNRLDQEVEAPTGDVTLVFTDIKNSTIMWETYSTAMQSAIKMHNETMRRQLRLIGGYEVKTEGDAFMVAFPTVTSALLWCFTIQTELLEVPWPQEILTSVNGQEVADADSNVLFRGLSVRMGIHWGQPVCETDPVTRRMDYFGPMVNRAARISGVADGGQITVSSEFIAEVQRLLETYIETDRSNSGGSEEQMNDDLQSAAIRRELRQLSSHGFEVKDLGERRLKGLENPEHIYLMYPHALAGRLAIQQQRDEAEKALWSRDGPSSKQAHSQLTVDLENVWDLWGISLRLEMLCSTLENKSSSALKPPETQLLERTKERGGEVTDRFLINFVEHQVSRIETCITSLALRNMVRPFSGGILSNACPMQDILTELSDQLSELRTIKQQIDFDMAPS